MVIFRILFRSKFAYSKFSKKTFANSLTFGINSNGIHENQLIMVIPLSKLFELNVKMVNQLEINHTLTLFAQSSN